MNTKKLSKNNENEKARQSGNSLAVSIRNKEYDSMKTVTVLGLKAKM